MSNLFQLAAFWGSVNAPGFVTAFQFVFVTSHSSCKFLHLCHFTCASASFMFGC